MCQIDEQHPEITDISETNLQAFWSTSGDIRKWLGVSVGYSRDFRTWQHPSCGTEDVHSRAKLLGFWHLNDILKIAQVYPIQSGYKPSNPFSNQQQNGERWRLQFFNSRITHLFNLVFTRSTVLISQPWHNVDRSGELKRWGEHECTWYEGVISRH